jgi:hypothetical protein
MKNYLWDDAITYISTSKIGISRPGDSRSRVTRVWLITAPEITILTNKILRNAFKRERESPGLEIPI